MKVPLHVIKSRRDRLAQMIGDNHYLPVRRLCEELGVSEATVRRDLAQLHLEKRIIRTFGGALSDLNTRFSSLNVAGTNAGTVSTPAALTSRAKGAETSAQDHVLFHSAEAERLKREICEIGRRMWAHEYCEGNGGNISARLAPNRFLCTPTGVSKGFMTPEMLCLVDGGGSQLAGSWKCSSEITTHLAIYHSTPDAASVCHAHPCHAGAFAIKGLQPPARLIPEMELFVGTVAVAGYMMPGSPEIAGSIRPLAPKHQSIIMGNHGVICWGTSVEDAYFKMEITDAYCRTVILAQAIPGGSAISGEGLHALLDRKKKMGLPDDRYGLEPAELGGVDPWLQMGGPRICPTPSKP